MQPLLRFLLFSTLIFPPVLFAQSDYKSPDIGVTFPAELAGMNLVKVTDYEKENAGLGIGLSYRAVKEKADLYIYSDGLSSIQDGTDFPEIQKHFEQVTDEVFEMGRRGYYQDVKTAGKADTVEIGNKPFLHIQLEFGQNGKMQTSHIYLTALKNRFFKIRYTYLSSEQREGKKTLEDLLKAAGTLLGQIQ